MTMKNKRIHYFGIDVKTKDAEKLIGRLNRLALTKAITNGMYHADRQYTQVLVGSPKSESELDRWLYETKHGCDYVGIFMLSEAQRLLVELSMRDSGESK